MVIYSQYLFDVVETNSKMKADNVSFLCSPPKTFFIDYSYSSDTHLYWVSWKDMFENVSYLRNTKFHKLYFLSCLLLFTSGKITLHVLFFQDCKKILVC